MRWLHQFSPFSSDYLTGHLIQFFAVNIYGEYIFCDTIMDCLMSVEGHAFCFGVLGKRDNLCFCVVRIIPALLSCHILSFIFIFIEESQIIQMFTGRH
jgi:hypothetical protein